MNVIVSYDKSKHYWRVRARQVPLQRTMKNSKKQASESGKAAQAAQDAKKVEFEKKKQTFIVRAIWTFVMIALFIGIILAGHVYIAMLIALLQILSYSEVINLTGEKRYFDDLPYGRLLSWYFMVVAMFYQKGESLFLFFRNVGIFDRFLFRLIAYHRLISYALYMGGLMFFVCTLRPNYYRQQFAQFTTTHMAIFFVVIQGNYIELNILHGLYWFLVPVSLVIVNDIMAYVCGITFGRTPLIAISPKKTVEGFLGAWFFTMIASVILTYLSASSDYMICPMDRVGISAFSDHTCVHDVVFVPRDYNFFNLHTFHFAPIYLHAIVLATFASLVAPFGGFFASGTKRAFKAKDFGDTIPGHGGITDRFDCQFVMGFFSCIYYDTFIKTPGYPDFRSVWDSVKMLSHDDQRRLSERLIQLTGSYQSAIDAVAGAIAGGDPAST